MIAKLTVLCCSALAVGSPIPPVYTAADRNVSPPLQWGAGPAGTKSFAVLCDDPDAPIGDWVHWVIFNIPADQTGLPEGVPQQAKRPDGSIQGLNDSRHPGYDGPYPPPGKPHRYFFKVFALDTMLSLGPAARKRDLLKAIEGHVLAQGEWMGTFLRR